MLTNTTFDFDNLLINVEINIRLINAVHSSFMLTSLMNLIVKRLRFL